MFHKFADTPLFSVFVVASMFLELTVAGCVATPPTTALTRADRAYDARIRRDDFGVPHIVGKTDADVAYGFGYAHSEDDFATIQETLLTSRGKLAALKGEEGVKSDTFYHLLEIPAILASGYERDLPADVRDVLDAYAAGINLYAAQHPGAASPLLGDVTGRDIAGLQLYRGPTFYGLDGIIDRLLSGTMPKDEGSGSNAVALAPGRSTDGHTRLLFNAHQPYTGAFSWYEAVLESGQGWHVAGGFFPGTPFLLGGHNEHLGWAATTNRPDLVDVYRLTINPENESQYRLDGKWLPFRTQAISIDVLQPDGSMKTTSKTLQWAKQGPVISNKEGTFAVRYPDFGGVKQLLQYYRMNKAANLAEWLAAMKLRALPNINYIYADETGNIGFLANGLYPLRAEGPDWSGVVPGDRSDLIWTRLRPYDQIPQIWNPKSGWLYNSNNTPFSATDPASDLDPAQYPKSMGLQMDMTNRAWRSLETYGVDPAISVEEFNEYKYDLRYSKKSDVQDIVTAILAVDAGDDPMFGKAQTIVREWDYGSDIDNRSTALIALTWLNMRRYQIAEVPAVRRSIDLLQTHFGRLDPKWGEVNRLRRGTVDLPLDGGPDALRAIYGRPDTDGRLRALNGDSFIMFVDWDENGRVQSRSVHQFGSATLDENSPHYADQTGLFAAKQTKPVLFTEDQLKGHIERSYSPAAPR